MEKTMTKRELQYIRKELRGALNVLEKTWQDWEKCNRLLVQYDERINKAILSIERVVRLVQEK